MTSMAICPLGQIQIFKASRGANFGAKLLTRCLILIQCDDLDGLRGCGRLHFEDGGNSLPFSSISQKVCIKPLSLTSTPPRSSVLNPPCMSKIMLVELLI